MPVAEISVTALALALGDAPAPVPGIAVAPTGALAVGDAPVATIIKTENVSITAVPARAAGSATLATPSISVTALATATGIAPSPTPSISVTAVVAIAAARSPAPTITLVIGVTVSAPAAIAVAVAGTGYGSPWGYDWGSGSSVTLAISVTASALAAGRGNPPVPTISVTAVAVAAGRADAPGHSGDVTVVPALAAGRGNLPVPSISVTAIAVAAGRADAPPVHSHLLLETFVQDGSSSSSWNIQHGTGVDDYCDVAGGVVFDIVFDGSIEQEFQGFTSKTAYDLFESHAIMEFKDSASWPVIGDAYVATDVWFSLTPDPTAANEAFSNPDALTLSFTTGGEGPPPTAWSFQHDGTSDIFDPASYTYRFCKFEESGGTVHAYVSTDAFTWVQIGIATTPNWATACYVQVGVAVANNDDPEIQWDNLNNFDVNVAAPAAVARGSISAPIAAAGSIHEINAPIATAQGRSDLTLASVTIGPLAAVARPTGVAPGLSTVEPNVTITAIVARALKGAALPIPAISVTALCDAVGRGNVPTVLATRNTAIVAVVALALADAPAPIPSVSLICILDNNGLAFTSEDLVLAALGSETLTATPLTAETLTADPLDSDLVLTPVSIDPL